MPRMRDAIRSGWKYSSWSSFSPTEISLIGRPVTALTERAALLQLVDRRGSLQVGRDEARTPAFLPQEQRELGGGGRLAGALEPGEEDHRRGASGERELRAAGAHQRSQLLVHRLHDLLAGREALQYLLTDRTLPNPGDEVLDDLEVDVGFEQRETDLAHRARDRFLVQLSTPAKITDGALQ